MASLGPNNSFPRKTCYRENCPLKEAKACWERCFKEGIVYEIKCNRCHEEQINSGVPEPKDSIYVGETSRTAFTRYHQHIRDYSVASRQPPQQQLDPEGKSSFMMNHTRQFHEGHMDVKGDYNISILSSNRDPLSRQSTEVVRIATALKSGIHTDPRGKEEKITSLNRKGEFFSPLERRIPEDDKSFLCFRLIQ